MAVTMTTNTETLACMGCGGVGLAPVLSLGNLPLANALLDESQLGQPEETFTRHHVLSSRGTTR